MALFAHFNSGAFSGDVQLIEPEPAIFALAAKRIGATSDALVFLDDHEPNVRSVQAAGWHALHFGDALEAEAGLHETCWDRC